MKRLERPIWRPEAPMRTSTKLRKRITDPNAPILICPGVHDGLSTRIACSLEFETLYLVNLRITISVLSFPKHN